MSGLDWFIITSSMIGGISCLIIAFIHYYRAKRLMHEVTNQMQELDQKVMHLIRKDIEPTVSHRYYSSKAREHCFELTVSNPFPEAITLSEIYTYAPQGKVSYVEMLFPNERTKNGLMKKEKYTYAEKATVDRVRSPLDVTIAPNRQVTIRYHVKFRDAVVISSRPDLYLCYYSISNSEIREVKISNKSPNHHIRGLSEKILSVASASPIPAITPARILQ